MAASVRRVPLLGGVVFCCVVRPAKQRAGTASPKRPAIMAIAVVML